MVNLCLSSRVMCRWLRGGDRTARQEAEGPQRRWERQHRSRPEARKRQTTQKQFGKRYNLAYVCKIYQFSLVFSKYFGRSMQNIQ